MDCSGAVGMLKQGEDVYTPACKADTGDCMASLALDVMSPSDHASMAELAQLHFRLVHHDICLLDHAEQIFDIFTLVKSTSACFLPLFTCWSMFTGKEGMKFCNIDVSTPLYLKSLPVVLDAQRRYQQRLLLPLGIRSARCRVQEGKTHQALWFLVAVAPDNNT